MSTNRTHLSALLATSVAAAALVCAPTLLAVPTPLGGVCVMTNPKTMCQTPGDVELNTSPSLIRYPNQTWPLLGDGSRKHGYR